MSDTLTEVVARLYRAGSENSKQNEKLRAAANELLQWIKDNAQVAPLPCDCTLYPSGNFVRTALTNPPHGTHRKVLEMRIGEQFTVYQLSAFSQLIADGFLEELCELMESQSQGFERTSDKVREFLPKQ